MLAHANKMAGGGNSSFASPGNVDSSCKLPMSLLHPAFLFALATAVIPVVIHLSQRRKFKEFAIGTLRFLHLAEKKRTRRLRIEERLLLLLRVTAVALLALIFARPFFPSATETNSAGGKTIVLLDASGSMTREMAEEAAKAARKALDPDETVTFARFTDGVEVLDRLEDYRSIPGAAGDVGQALDWALEHLRNEGLESGRVIIAGHFATAALPSSPPRVWPPRVPVEAIAIEAPSDNNDAVLSAELITPFVTEEMQIEARVTPADHPREITLSAEGLNLKQAVPAGLARALFSFRPPREVVRGTVSLAGNDAWPADDQRPFAIRWMEPEPVLILDGSPGSTPFEGQGYFLDKALAASGAAHGLSPFRPEIRYGIAGREPTGDDTSAAPLGAIDLDAFSAIALCGPTQISFSDAREIAARVAAGAGLFIAIDARWTPEATALLADLGLFPSSVDLRGGMLERHLASWDREHPALSPFHEPDGGDLRLLTWRDAFLIHHGEGWKPLATLEGGHPVLLEKVATDPAAGPVIVLAHGLTREWTDLPREPLFVPLVKSLFAHLTRYQPQQHSAVVRHPGLRENREIGSYSLPDGAAEVVAADPGEASVAAVDAATFRKAYGLPDATAPAPSVQTEPDQAAGTKTGEWWPWLVLFCFLLLVAEGIVATRRPPPLQPSPGA